MLRYLSTGSSTIAALMAADPEASVTASARPDLLEFLLIRTLGAHTASVALRPGPPAPPAWASEPDQPGTGTG